MCCQLSSSYLWQFILTLSVFNYKTGKSDARRNEAEGYKARLGSRTFLELERTGAWLLMAYTGASVFDNHSQSRRSLRPSRQKRTFQLLSERDLKIGSSLLRLTKELVGKFEKKHVEKRLSPRCRSLMSRPGCVLRLLFDLFDCQSLSNT